MTALNMISRSSCRDLSIRSFWMWDFAWDWHPSAEQHLVLLHLLSDSAVLPDVAT